MFRKLHTKVAVYRRYLRAKAADWARLNANLAFWDGPTRPARSQDGRPLAERRSSRPGSRSRRPDTRSGPAAQQPLRLRCYGPALPDGVLEDDGADRGIIFVLAGAHLKRQFEFVKTQWLNDGIFIGAPAEKDPLVGPDDGDGGFTIPTRPIRRRLQGLPPFVVTRGGEYCFAPGLRAMRWLAELQT